MASAPDVGFTLILTVGLSLSVMLNDCEVIAPKLIQELGAEIVKVAFSVPSYKRSSKTVKVTEPVVAPFAIVIDVGSPVKSAEVAVPVIPKLTVWVPTTTADAVAVRVTDVARDSEPKLVFIFKLTVGKSLSVIVATCDVVLPSIIPEDGLLIEKVPVSVHSYIASSATTTVAVPVV